MDLDSIDAGLDFAEVIEVKVDSCTVLVALIGASVGDGADEEGNRRLDNPDEFVRFEVQTALQRREEPSPPSSEKNRHASRSIITACPTPRITSCMRARR